MHSHSLSPRLHSHGRCSFSVPLKSRSSLQNSATLLPSPTTTQRFILATIQILFFKKRFRPVFCFPLNFKSSIGIGKGFCKSVWSREGKCVSMLTVSVWQASGVWSHRSSVLIGELLCPVILSCCSQSCAAASVLRV